MKERPAVSEPEGRILKRVPFRSTPHAAYTAVGLLLGFGAPVGALLLRTLIDAQARAQPLLELRQNAFFYLYTFIGTSLVFGLAGFVAGDRAERLRKSEDFWHRIAAGVPAPSDDDLLAVADEALYLRRRNGRNQEAQPH